MGKKKTIKEHALKAKNRIGLGIGVYVEHCIVGQWQSDSKHLPCGSGEQWNESVDHKEKTMRYCQE